MCQKGFSKHLHSDAETERINLSQTYLSVPQLLVMLEFVTLFTVYILYVSESVIYSHCTVDD